MKVYFGFYPTLLEILKKRKEGGAIAVARGVVYYELKNKIPSLDLKHLDIYIRDKQQQERIGFKYDSKNKVFIL